MLKWLDPEVLKTCRLLIFIYKNQVKNIIQLTVKKDEPLNSVPVLILRVPMRAYTLYYTNSKDTIYIVN